MYEGIKSIKELNRNERPCEKCMLLGPEALSDQELLAILLRTGTRESSVLELAEELLKLNPQYDGLVNLMHLDQKEFMKLHGIGPARAVQLCAVGEMARRIWQRERRRETLSFRNAEQVYLYYKEDLRYLDHEVIRVLFLDSHMQLIRESLISSGTCDHTAVSAREILKEGLRLSAVCMIMVHNHPSGDPTPSREDAEFTGNLRKGGAFIGITLLDHVVIGDNRYYSFKNQEAL